MRELLFLDNKLGLKLEINVLGFNFPGSFQKTKIITMGAKNMALQPFSGVLN